MFETIESFDTEFSADSVEWCPTSGFQDVFVCGTYQLTAQDGESGGITGTGEEKKRVGRIYLFQVSKRDGNKARMELRQWLDVPAVLDMKWAHTECLNGRTLLGVVNADGMLQIYELVKTEAEEKVTLKLLSEVSVAETPDEAVLALSLDWSTGRRLSEESTEVKIVVSDSVGGITVFMLAESGDAERISHWHAHDFEAWISAFDYWNTNVVYTGGDDCKFLRFDTRVQPCAPVTTNRCHNAGVTSLHSSWRREFCLVSGSYDEILRTWDTRTLRRPLAECQIGGGLWRLKWDPHEARRLLVAGMYYGFFIVDCESLDRPEVVAEYKEHESIAYGCDWTYMDEEEDNATMVGTCSFYDHLLKLSVVRFKE